MTSPALTAVASIAGKIKRLQSPPLVVIDGTTIPPPQYRTRVLMETNLAPIGGQFPAHDYLATLGMKRAIVGYAALFNRATWWARYKTLAEWQQFGAADPEGDVEHQPPSEAACRAIGKLLANPAWFGGVADPNPPLVLNIESGANVFRPTDTPDERLVKIQSWRNALAWIRAEAGAAQEIWMYDQIGYDVPTATPRDDVDVAMAMWRVLQNQAGGYFYWTEEQAAAPSRWYADACDIIARIRRVQPIGGVVTICPTQNIYNKAFWPALAHLDGTPVPFDTFAAAVTLFASAGITLVFWTGNAAVEGIKPHAAFFASHNQH